MIDRPVRIDPREPWGGVRIAVKYPEEQELAGLAADALASYYDGDEDATDSNALN